MAVGSGASEKPVLTVGKQGAEYTTIQATIDAAPAGAILRIGPGEYAGGIKIEKPLTLQGDGWEQTTILAPCTSPEEIEEAAGEAMRKAEQLKTAEERKAAEWAFHDKYLGPAILVVNTRGVEIRDLKITCQGPPIQLRTHPHAHVVLRVAEAKIIDCAILGSAGSGVFLAFGSEAEIRGSLVAGVWRTGIEIGVRGEQSKCRAVVTDCDVRNCYYAGIMIRKGHEAEVEQCWISGAAWHGIRYDDSAPKVFGNRIVGNHRSGIYASGATAATVRQNLLLKNGMGCWFENRDAIVENTFAVCKDAGLWMLGESQPVVERNLFFEQDQGIVCSSIDAAHPAAKSVGKPNLKDNVFWKVGSPFVRRKAGRAATETPEEVNLADAQGKVLNPMFSSPETDDFALSPESPLRRSHVGAADPLPANSNWPLQPEEQAIIPDGPTRDDRQWKLTIESRE
jgi:hypothetical protein